MRPYARLYRRWGRGRGIPRQPNGSWECHLFLTKNRAVLWGTSVANRFFGSVEVSIYGKKKFKRILSCLVHYVFFCPQTWFLRRSNTFSQEKYRRVNLDRAAIDKQLSKYQMRPHLLTQQAWPSDHSQREKIFF